MSSLRLPAPSIKLQNCENSTGINLNKFDLGPISKESATFNTCSIELKFEKKKSGKKIIFLLDPSSSTLRSFICSCFHSVSKFILFLPMEQPTLTNSGKSNSTTERTKKRDPGKITRAIKVAVSAHISCFKNTIQLRPVRIFVVFECYITNLVMITSTTYCKACWRWNSRKNVYVDVLRVSSIHGRLHSDDV